jgi:glycosyltransferase A (GT-A) superfamily protein (DUF2064 family)
MCALRFEGSRHAKLCAAIGSRGCLQYVNLLLQRTLTVKYSQRGQCASNIHLACEHLLSTHAPDIHL